MALKKIGAAVCSIALLSGCMTGTQATNLFSSHVEAKNNNQDGTPEEITLSGIAEPFLQVLVSPSIEGKIKNLYADLGVYVKQGEKLAELDEGNLASQVKQAENQIKVVEAQGNLTAMEQQITLNQAMASLNQTMVGLNTSLPPEAPRLPEMSGFPELEAAKTAVKDAELALAEITQEWEETNELFQNGIVSKKEMDQVTSSKAKAELELEKAKEKVNTETLKIDIQQKYEQEKKAYEQELAKYEQEKAKFDKEANHASKQTEKSARDTIKLQQESSTVTSKMTQIAIENAKAELEAVKEQYNYLQIVAPVNGFITDKKGRIGEMAAPGESLFVITNLDQLYVTVNVPEAMINLWKENQSVKVMFPTQDVTVNGKVVYIGLMPNNGEQTYPVKVLVENANHKIRGGMKAVVTWKKEAKDNETKIKEDSDN